MIVIVIVACGDDVASAAAAAAVFVSSLLDQSMFSMLLALDVSAFASVIGCVLRSRKFSTSSHRDVDNVVHDRMGVTHGLRPFIEILRP